MPSRAAPCAAPGAAPRSAPTGLPFTIEIGPGSKIGPNRLRIDPFAYLQDVYARLPTTSAEELPLLLPDRWIADRPQHLIQQRVQEALDRAQRARERRAERRRAAA